MPDRSEGPLSAKLTRRDLMRYSARGAGAVVVIGPLSSILAACGDDSPPAASGSPSGSGLTLAEVQAATGTVNVLSWEWYKVPEENPPGLKAKWAFLATNEDTLTKTQQAGAFDVIGIFQGQIDQLLSLDRLEALDISLLPNWTGMNQMFQDTDVVRRDGQVWAAPFQWGYAYFVYDKRQTSAPTSFDALKTPELKGKVGVPDDPYAVITTFASLNGLAEPNLLTPDQFQQVVDSMTAFKPQLQTVYTYGEAPQLLSQQDIAIAFPEFGPTVLTAQDAGADAELALLNAWSYVDCLMIVKGTTNLAGAYRWIDTAISEPAQNAVSAQGLAFPVVDTAVAALPKEMQYTTPEEILTQAPLQPGVPIDTSGGFVPYQDWLTAWNDFKA